MEVTKNGDKIYWPITVSNTGVSANTNVEVQITIPPGLVIETYSTNKGNLNKTTGLWTIGSQNIGTTYQNTVTFKVIDISLATEESGLFGFELVAVVSGDNIDPNSINNTKTAFIEITTCPPSAGAENDLNACMCGDVSENDTPCTHGTTEYRLSLGSLVNLHADFTLDVATGKYNAMGMILNPFEPASFTYSIWCTPQGGAALQTAGPATVEIPALFPTTFTDSLVILDEETAPGLGFAKHTALDGSTTTFPLGWTTVVEDSGTGNLIFTYPDGNTVTVNLGSVTNPGQTVFPSVISGNITLTNLTMCNFHKINDSGGATIGIVIPDPATLGLAANRTHTWTFNRINVRDTGSITLTPDNFKTINGQASFVFSVNDYASVTLWTDGVNYFIS